MLVKTFWEGWAEIDLVNGWDPDRKPVEFVDKMVVEGSTSSECCGDGPFQYIIYLNGDIIRISGVQLSAICGGGGYRLESIRGELSIVDKMIDVFSGKLETTFIDYAEVGDDWKRF